MSEVEPPTERTCLRCGRHTVWDEERETWVAHDEDDHGRPHCVHEWDINGSYRPLE